MRENQHKTVSHSLVTCLTPKPCLNTVTQTSMAPLQHTEPRIENVFAVALSRLHSLSVPYSDLMKQKQDNIRNGPHISQSTHAGIGHTCICFFIPNTDTDRNTD